jgi:hypothetical protein
LLRSVFFTDVNTGYAVGTAGKIIKTTDGGQTWVSQTSGTTQTLFSVYFINSTTGYASGNSGTILKTTDSGVTWTPEVSGTTADLYFIHFVNGSAGFTSGTGGTIRRTQLSTGINPPADSPMSLLFNNAIRDRLQFELPEGELKGVLKIYNSSGRLLRMVQCASSVDIDVSEWSSGVYYMEVQTDSRKWREKFIKMK